MKLLNSSFKITCISYSLLLVANFTVITANAGGKGSNSIIFYSGPGLNHRIYYYPNGGVNSSNIRTQGTSKLIESNINGSPFSEVSLRIIKRYSPPKKVIYSTKL